MLVCMCVVVGSCTHLFRVRAPSGARRNGLDGDDVSFTPRRSRVRVTLSVFVLLE